MIRYLRALVNREKAFLTLMLLFTSLNVFSQCPTITNPNITVCNAAGYNFNNLSTNASSSNGISWYLTPTGGTAIAATQLVRPNTYYADNSMGNCGTRPSITVTFEVPPSGRSLDAIYCSNEDPTVQDYIADAVNPNIPTGGSAAVYSDFQLTQLVNPATPLTGNRNYFVVFQNAAGCRSQIETGSSAVFPSPADPTPPSVQEFCINTNPTIASLNPGTTSAVTWYLAVNSNGDPIPPPLDPSTPLVDGTTYYVFANNFFCESNFATVLVNISPLAEAGDSVSQEFCETSVPTTDFDLFSLLGGTPQNNGIWTGPLATTNGDRGTVNISSLTAGQYVFTYTVMGTGSCPDDTATVTFNIVPVLSSGVVAASNPARFCVNTLPTSFDLLTLLDNEDAGGIWTMGATSAGAPIANPINLSGYTPGNYDFTYTQNSTTACPDEFTTVRVVVLLNPMAGNAVPVSFCENEVTTNSPFDLFDALDGSQTNNMGVWTNAQGTVVPNTIDISAFSVANSPYSFTYTIDNGTCSDTETITITILPAPESGNYIGTPYQVCEDQTAANSPYNLFSLLDGTQDTNGTWYIGSDTTGTVIANPINLATLGTGSFNFTYSVPAIGSCTDVPVTVEIIILERPNTGIASPITFCENDLAANSPLDLFSQLLGNVAGGTWTDDNTTGRLTGSSVNLVGLAIGTYNFSYTITDVNGCTNSSTVSITVSKSPDAGTATNFEICLINTATTTSLDLNTRLTSNDTNGTWNDDNATGALSGSTVTLSGLPAGIYNFTYTVPALGTCPADSATVQVTINDTPAPTAAATQSFCDTATIGDISIMGTSVIWYSDIARTNILPSGTALTDMTTYYASQTNATTGCESSTLTSVQIRIFQTPNSGVAIPLNVCNDQTAVNLFTALNGTQTAGGTWIDTDGTGALSGNTVNASLLANGNYRFEYFVTGTAPCGNSSTIVTINVSSPVSAGTSSTLAVCSDASSVDLFTLLGGASTGGTWSPMLASGTGVYDPAVDVSGTYTYSVSSACNTSTASVVVTETPAANAGSNATATVCVVDGSFDLTTLLNGTPDANGTWSPLLASGTNIFNPAMDTSGTYVYTVNPTGPCSATATSQIVITVNNTPAPMQVAASLTFCRNDVPMVTDLDAAVTGSNILWYSSVNATMPLNATDVLQNGQTYFATATNATGCESSQRTQVTVVVNDVASPTLINDGNLFCINDAPTVQNLVVNVNEFNTSSNNIRVYDAPLNGNLISNTTLLQNNSTYYIAIFNSVTGCESSTRLAVTADLTNCGLVALPDGFSPNGDNINDLFEIPNLNVLYPNYSIEIYNRYGNVVYKGNANTPSFNGVSNQSGTLGSELLPVGVYFYILQFNDGSTPNQDGRLYLSR